MHIDPKNHQKFRSPYYLVSVFHFLNHGIFHAKALLVLLTCMPDRRPHSMLRRLLWRRVPGASCTWSWSCPPGRACLLCKSSRHHQKGSETFKTRVTKTDFSEPLGTGTFLGIGRELLFWQLPSIRTLENNNNTEP